MTAALGRSLLLLAGVSAFAAAPAEKPRTSANQELREGLLAHLDGDDAAALRHFAACRKRAFPGGDDDVSCSVYGDMFGKGRAKDDGASRPRARAAYAAAVAAFKSGDLAAADRGWHECLELSEVATAVRNDCLAAIDLIPRKPAEPEGSEPGKVYMDGLMLHSLGLHDKAAEAWTRCAETAKPGSDTQRDCRAGLEKLKTP